MKDLNDIILRNIGVLALLFVNGQRAQSPCPGIFDYQRDGNITYGLVHLEPSVPVPQLVVQAYFTIAGQVPSTNLGSFEPLGGSDLNRTINPGEVVTLRVHFPVIKPLPRLITLTVNNEPICYGPEERPPPNHAVTVINLEYNAALPLKPPAPLPIANPDQSSASCLQSSDHIGETSESLEDVCGTVPLKKAVPLILRGESYPRGDWPWLVAVFKQTRFNLLLQCVATLISKRHVVSSVSCTEDPKKKGRTLLLDEMLVKVGAYDLNDWTEEHTVTVGIKNITIHDDYNSEVYRNDIIVLTLNKDLLFNNYIRPICLWREETKEQENVIGHNGVVTGWSRNVNNGTGPEKPTQGKFLIVSTEDCRASSHAEFDDFTRDTTLCAGYRNGTGVCDGDWGAGMYLREKGDPKWRLRAVVSSWLDSGDGFLCNVYQYVIFTDVAQYLPWIKNIMATT
ncbi:hypothetical protein K1T71_011377 [Dendrolimus kikuchii]|uniref:Uncharacterized protein n=1 Tax=Dendrolimus kikuchii TaxID=765133 RepID=A0ACC1CNU1_9NEOP|nr:hypothetical protein K1T71_011377 [Dendrolimus kikuchii]